MAGGRTGVFQKCGGSMSDGELLAVIVLVINAIILYKIMDG